MTGRPPPNLSDPAERAAYRRELRGVARRTRFSGIAFALIGLALLYASKGAVDPRLLRTLGIVAITAGFGLMIFATMRRTLYHELRMNPPGDL